MRALQSFFYRFAIAGELLAFLWRRKLWWLIPMVTMLLILGILVILAQAAGVTPFIYPIF